ncbi:ribbon-helix-helix domain-containing protein (plasmid) [Rhizobium leguminosarum]
MIENLMIRPQSEFAAECCGMLRRLDLGKDGRDAERVTTTLTRMQKAELDRLAKAQGVKVAWLVRRAVERFLEESAGGPMLPLDFEGGEDAKR